MLIQSNRVWIADQFIPAQIEIDDNKIINIYKHNEKDGAYDYINKRIVPGFIDIHCHGAYGYDTNDASEEGLKNWTKNIPQEGVTALLPTTTTQSKEVLSNALANVAKVIEQGYQGAEILGIHFEGPYFIAKPTIEEFREYQKAAKGLIKYVTMATELDEDYELTKYLYDNNIVVSIGHSVSTYEEAIYAFANGARSQTHVYNKITSFNHRENGLVTFNLRVKEMYGEIICDKKLSTSVDLYNFFNSKGPYYGIMITDATMSKTYNDSKYLVDDDLDGSTLKMNEGLKILVEDAMVPFNYAINSCTINPARCIGIDSQKGRIGVGYDSDLVVLNDDYSVHQTYCLGKAML